MKIAEDADVFIRAEAEARLARGAGYWHGEGFCFFLRYALSKRSHLRVNWVRLHAGTVPLDNFRDSGTVFAKQ